MGLFENLVGSLTRLAKCDAFCFLKRLLFRN
jgi:hypothetical protein